MQRYVVAGSQILFITSLWLVLVGAFGPLALRQHSVGYLLLNGHGRLAPVPIKNGIFSANDLRTAFRCNSDPPILLPL